MQLQAEKLLLSATDLAKHLGCRHLTFLDQGAAEGRLTPPTWRDPALELLQERGLAHEAAYLDTLEAAGRTVRRLREGEEPGEAMEAGAEVIVQVPLREGRWRGRADVLLRVDSPSALGDWSYEIVDTKLARTTSAGTLLQLCLYSDLLAGLQGQHPERMHVVTPGTDFALESYRLDEFLAYYRLVRQRLEESVAAVPPSTYPDPVSQCDACRWWVACDRQRHDDDHLCLVAGIRSQQTLQLQQHGLQTLGGLAQADSLPGVGARAETFQGLREQARLQVASREAGTPRYELLPHEPSLGLARLPLPDAGDVFLDLEGDRFADEGGREYLIGYAWHDSTGTLTYEGLWATDRASEKRAFESLIDFLDERWSEHPGLHVYHFGHYEPTAIKKLMGRHATREDEVDRLLRGKRFVDLYAVVRQGIRAGVESYSLKDLEPFSGFTRSVDLREASRSLRATERIIELEQPLNDELRDCVEGYNREDCFSTEALRGWLEERRLELIDSGSEVARPEDGDGAASLAITERRAEIQQVHDALMEGMPDEPEERDAAQKVRWLLAQLLDYFRREGKATWWEYYHHHEMTAEELLADRAALSGLRFAGTRGGTARCPIERYTFPPQEAHFRRKEQLHEPGGEQVGEVAAFHLAAGTVDIKKRMAAAGTHPTSVFSHDYFPPKAMEGALLAFGQAMAAGQWEQDTSFLAARDLLLRRPPQGESVSGPLAAAGENALAAGCRILRGMEGGVLPLQGPPGSGKTYAAARMIVQQIEAGRRVGVTAVSHKVIRNLLDEVHRAATEKGVTVRCVHKGGDEPAEGSFVIQAGSTGDALGEVTAGTVVGGTAWLWSADDAAGRLDDLFVDEAGQMSLAYVLAVSRAAKNVVLLGDPQQLEQPQQGSHPEGVGVAALVHVLDGEATMPPDRGLFLAETWRLPPELCSFTSEIYYEGRLQSRPGLEQQELLGSTPLAGRALVHVPVEHSGNQNLSIEEVDAAAWLVEMLLHPAGAWRDREGVERTLTTRDILVVAPYNAQVAALQERLGDIRVGTVDKFQGQQAPVVLYSMATSSPEEAPRGMEFLYSPNRMNVATSRARCTSILIANPALFEPECRTPDQMRWANGLCRFRELAGILEPSGRMAEGATS